MKTEKTDKDTIYLQSLGSSSKGNCTFVWDAETRLLIDCGFAPSYLRDRLKTHGKTLRSISAVLITHIHGDHIYPPAVNDFMRLGVRIVCHENIAEPLFRRYGKMFDAGYEKSFQLPGDDGMDIGNFGVQPFEVPHDSDGGCFGYSITKACDGKTKKICVATDIAYADTKTEKRFVDSDIIVIESNYDIEMLDASPRPWILKNRIKESGHLSNGQCAEFLCGVLRASAKLPKAILLAHISQECNTNELALRTVSEALAREGFAAARVLETFMASPGEIVSA